MKMTPANQHSKLFKTTPIHMSSSNLDDNSIRATSGTTNTIGSSATEGKLASCSDNLVCTQQGTASTASSSSMDHVSPDNKANNGRRPPVPKQHKFFEATPIEMTSFTEAGNNSILSDGKQEAPTMQASSPRGSHGCVSEGMADSSVLSRHSLQHSIFSRRHTLTPQEADFLEDLIQNGNEFEIQVACEKLSDDNLFFDHPHFTSGSITTLGADSLGNLGNLNNSISSRPDDSTFRPDESETIDPVDNTMVRSRAASLPCGNVLECFGSERRQEQLLERKKSNALTQKMWKAHENGLAVSATASRRSVMLRRENSIGSMNNSLNNSSRGGMGRRDRWSLHQQRMKPDSIFRTKRPTSPPSMKTATNEGIMDDIQSDNYRRNSSFRRRSSLDFSKSGRTAGIQTARVFPRPLRRMQSEACIPRNRSGSNISNSSNAKSVSFAAIPRPMHGALRTVSDGIPQRRHSTQANFGTVLNNKKTPPVRENSVLSEGSIPSLHMAHEIMSPTGSVTSGHSSFYPPSIHLAHAVFSSESLGRTDDMIDDGEEKKSTSTWEDEGRIGHQKHVPLKVEIPGVQATGRMVLSDQPAMIQDATKVLTSKSVVDVDDVEIERPVIVRRASQNDEAGDEGIEVADWETEHVSPTGILFRNSESSSNTNLLLNLRDERGCSSSDFDILGGSNAIQSWYQTNSFDDSHFLDHNGHSGNNKDNSISIFRRVIRRSLSDESVGFRKTYSTRHCLMDDSLNSTSISVREMSYSSPPYDDDYGNMVSQVSWKMDADDEDDGFDDGEGYDAWKVIEDEYVNGYGGGGTLPFLILGTSADDVDAHPHVLSPPLMESLLAFVPPALAGDNYWMKYSLVRDGASMHSFLQRSRGARYTFLAIETVDGEVFGAFTSAPWRKNWNYFGNGESFLWKMRKSRKQKAHSIIDQAHIESEIDVYPFTGNNNCIQLCTHDRIAVGGGMPKSPSSDDLIMSRSLSFPTPTQTISEETLSDAAKQHEWGFGLSINGDLLHGTSSPCLTYGSPSMSKIHSDGSLFEVMNLELWSLTPCLKLEDAEKLELSSLFLEKHLQ